MSKNITGCVIFLDTNFGQSIVWRGLSVSPLSEPGWTGMQGFGLSWFTQVQKTLPTL